MARLESESSSLFSLRKIISVLRPNRIADVDVAQESANCPSANSGSVWNGHAGAGQDAAAIGS